MAEGFPEYQSIEEIRKHLEFTERELENINFLEAEGLQVNQLNPKSRPQNPPPSSPIAPPTDPLTLDDLSPRSPGVTPPRRSQKPPASTLSTPEASWVSERRGVTHHTQGPSTISDSMDSARSRESDTFSQKNHGEMGAGFLEEENEELRAKLQQMRKTNSELTTSNHDLLNQLENLEHQQRQGKRRIAQCTSFLEDKDGQLTQFKEEILEKVEQLHSAHAAIRELEAERELMEEERRKQTEQHSQSSQSHSEHLRALETELAASEKLRTKAEKECQRALEAAELMQSSVEDYHRKSKEKVTQYETAELEMRANFEESEQKQAILKQKLLEIIAENNELREELSHHQKEADGEKEARLSGEQQNLELRTQVAKLTARLGKCERGSSVSTELQRQNTALDRQVTELQSQLRDSMREAGDLRAKLDQALACREALDPSDSGLGLYDTGSSALILELREKLRCRDQEIASLQSQLDKSGDETTLTLNSSVQTSQQDRKIRELELLLQSLEEERGRYASKFLSQEERRTELELQAGSLTSRLQQRTQQADQLQGELSDVSNKMVATERQLRKAQKEATTLERDLEDQTRETQQYRARTQELEGEVQEKTHEATQLAKQTQLLGHKLSEVETENAHLQKSLAQTNQASQSEVLQLRALLSEKQSELQKTLTDMDHVAQDLNAKQMAIADMTHELRSAQQDAQRSVSEAEQRASQATGQVSELTAALEGCRDELNSCMDQISQAKSDHEEVMTQKTRMIADLDSEVKRLRQLNSDKDSRLSELELSSQTRQQELLTGTDRLTQLQHQVSLLEEQLSSERDRSSAERSRLSEQSALLQNKLRSACDSLEQGERLIRDKTRQIDEMKRHLSTAEADLDTARSQLEDAQTDSQQLEEQLEQLEAERREARDTARTHRQRVETSEEDLLQARDEVEEKTRRLSELSTQLHSQTRYLSQAKIELEGARSQLQVLEETNRRQSETIQEKEGQLTNLNNRYSAAQESLHHKQQEMEQLMVTLQQQQWQLQQRSSQVGQLDVVLKEHQNQMDQRLSTLEGALKKSQLEATQRTKQVSLLDEHVSRLKDELLEKDLQLAEATQGASRQQLALNTSSDNVTTLQKQVQDLKVQILKTKDENEVLQKELDATRGEESRLQQALTEAQCELSLTQRQQERVNSQLQETIEQCQTQKTSAHSLAEALQLLTAQKAQLESRHEAAQRQLVRDVDGIKETYQKQLEDLRSQTADSLHREQSSLRSDLSSARDAQRHLASELDTTRAALDAARREVKVTRETLNSTNSSLMVKEAEVIRLGARLAEMTHHRNMGTFSDRLSGASSLGSSTRAISELSVQDTNNQGHSNRQQEPSGDHRTTAEELTNLQLEQSFDLHKSYPPSGAHKNFHTTLSSDLQTTSNGPGSQFMSLSISDISKLDNTSARYVISEPDDPESLQSMLREVQKFRVSDDSHSVGGDSTLSEESEKQKRTTTGSSRLFGSDAWPSAKTTSTLGSSKSTLGNSSKVPGAARKSSTLPQKKNAKVDSLRKSKGPMHSSPHSKKVKSVFGLSNQNKKPASNRNSKPTDESRYADKDFPGKQNHPTQKQSAQLKKTNIKSPDFQQHSPNVSTAMAHYDCDDESLVHELFPERDDNCAAETGDNRTVQGRIPSGVAGKSSGKNPAAGKATAKGSGAPLSQFGLDLEARKRALQAMTAELQCQIHAVDQHLGS